MHTGSASPLSILSAPAAQRAVPADAAHVGRSPSRPGDGGTPPSSTRASRAMAGDLPDCRGTGPRARPLQKLRLARSVLAWILIVCAAHSTGCAHAGAITANSSAASADTPMSRPDELPEALRGVWYRDDATGHAQCERYRGASPQVIDEESIAMIGSLVITPRLVHEYADYGEGTFFAVRTINRSGNAWQIEAAVGIDTISTLEPDQDPDPYRLELAQGKLLWEPWDDALQSQPYFRCGNVRPDYLGRAAP